MVESMRDEQLAVLICRKESFIVYIDYENGYFRPIYGVEPKLAHTVVYVRGVNGVVQATICKVRGSNFTFEDKDDEKGTELFFLEEIPKQSYSPYGQPKFKDVPLSRIACVFKRISTTLLEQTLAKNAKDKEYDFDILD